MQRCPICGTEVATIPRYPRYLCRACVSRAQTSEGRSLTFGADKWGTFLARFTDTGEIHQMEECQCFVDGVECTAREDYYGGYIVLATGENPVQPPA